ncbi:late embryogenis abundant protein 41-like [Silene latifolia]|uniref:late embryogenis abundant protein 41-like n=1 Tax=Silene latifolia TaxID=37657 RepID=UPI003D7828C4
MARSLSNAKVFVSLVANNFSSAFQRRGLANVSQGVTAVGKGSPRMGKTLPKDVGHPSEKAWIPDPATGFYRPANRAEEIDVAQLREIFLKHKIRSQ